MSTGDRTVLGRISKRGNGYLRTLFMQAARVILLRSANWPKHSFGLWLVRAAQRKPAPAEWPVLLGVADTKMAAALSKTIRAEGIHAKFFGGRHGLADQAVYRRLRTNQDTRVGVASSMSVDEGSHS